MMIYICILICSRSTLENETKIMDFWMLVLAQLLLLFAVIFLYVQHKYSFWSKKGIQGPKPWPLLGNLIESLSQGEVATTVEWHRKYGPIYGTYNGLQPVLNIADPEMIKRVMIKDFSVFMNRMKGVVLNEIDLHSLFNLENDDWKRVRAITSPSFTSGKLRGMSAMMNRSVDKLIDYFTKITSNSESSGVIDTKVVMTGFTIDVIASTSFATETNANGDRSEQNPFVEQTKKMFNFGVIKILSTLLLPRAVHRIRESVFPPNKDETFFYDLARQIIKQRRANSTVGAKRNDFVQLMDATIEANELEKADFGQFTASVDQEDDHSTKKSSSEASSSKTAKSLSELEIVSTSVLFFIAGFETTASTLTHTLFELAVNQDVQERLYEQLSRTLEQLEPDCTDYNETILSQIPYLEATMKETLRKYPPLARLQRRVGVDGYKLGHLTLSKDQLVNVSAYAVHHSAEYYPEPERFNPDRFMLENKHLLVPYTYMPFGQGPRNCVGMRFAYQEIKMCLAKILIKFQFLPTEGTPAILELGKNGLSTAKTFPLKAIRRA